MAVKFKVHFQKLVLKKAAETGVPILQKDIQRDTGLSLPTIGRWISGDVDRVEPQTLYRLTKYLECGICDLIELEESEEVSEN